MIPFLVLADPVTKRVALVCGVSWALLALAPANGVADPTNSPTASPQEQTSQPAPVPDVPPANSAAPPQPEPLALYDVDAMAARMPSKQDDYQKLRDDLLGLYSSQHPAAAPYDDQAREALRLAAYFLTWGDIYGEGVMRDLTLFSQAANHGGCSDPMIADLYIMGWLSSHNPGTDARAVEISNELTSAAQRPSPTVLKAWETEGAIHAIMGANWNAQTPNLQTPSMQLFPKVMSQWEQVYAQLVQEKAPASTLWNRAANVLGFCQRSDDTIGVAIGAIDQAYNETGTASGLRLALDGDYYIKWAWVARGAGYANTVNDQQWQLFGQRLKQAQQILETAYTQYPDEPAISNMMLTVALGESLDRDTMETWFQRAIKADPNDYAAYAGKIWYLQPRWYGNATEVWKFGQECAATQNWTYKIPMALTDGLNDVADNGDPDVFANDAVWKLTESVYRKYLDLYPRSDTFRTYFLRAAYLGHHQDVVAEQIKILGKNWDRSLFSLAEYRKIRASVGP